MAIGLLVSGDLAFAAGFTGDRGYDKLDVRDESYYDFTGLTVNVEQHKNNTGIIVRRSPEATVARGGRVVGTGINRTESWRKVYNAGNGACLIFKDSPAFTVEHLYGEFCWDGIRPGAAATDWTVQYNWLNNIRDDSVENDRCFDGRVVRNFFEDVHTLLSARPGKNGDAERPACNYDLEFVGNVASMGHHFEDREKRTYGWSPDPNYNSGQFFKVDGEGKGTRVLFKDNVIKADLAPNVSASKLRLIPFDWQILPGSGNNIFVWLGGSDIPGLTYTTIDDCVVPERFEIPQDLFTVTCDAQVWEDAKARWITEVWDAIATPNTVSP